MFTIKGYDKTVVYFYNAKIPYPLINFRYNVQPSQPMPSLLNCSQAVIDYGIALGIKDANTALKSQDLRLNIIEELYNEMRSKIIYP